MENGGISRVFGTHALARQAAADLEQAGVNRDGISVIDSGGGTVLTVTFGPEQTPVVEAVLARHATLPAASPPLDDTIQLRDGAPAYVAGGTANLGIPEAG